MVIAAVTHSPSPTVTGAACSSTITCAATSTTGGTTESLYRLY